MTSPNSQLASSHSECQKLTRLHLEDVHASPICERVYVVHATGSRHLLMHKSAFIATLQHINILKWQCTMFSTLRRIHAGVWVCSVVSSGIQDTVSVYKDGPAVCACACFVNINPRPLPTHWTGCPTIFRNSQKEPPLFHMRRQKEDQT